jgi:hypothetical protein
MKDLRGKRIIISGLISSKVNIDEYLTPVRHEIESNAGQIVAELIQRRGVSRSKKPGGSSKLDLPLSSRTYISSGKVEELKELSVKVDADLIIFTNQLTSSQMRNIEALIGLEILISDTYSK